MQALEGIQTLGHEAMSRADAELTASLRPSLHGLISLLVEREERRQSVDQRLRATPVLPARPFRACMSAVL